MQSEETLRRSQRRAWIILFTLAVIGGAAYMTLRFVIPRSRVPTGSMRPTIHVDDHVLVNQLAYRFGAKPKAGDVIAFRDGNAKFIYRVVAVPGDTVEMRDDVLIVNGTPRVEPYAIHISPDVPMIRNVRPLRVAAGEYFVLGDNRDSANDSRFRGTIPEERILGRMFHVLHVGRCKE